MTTIRVVHISDWHGDPCWKAVGLDKLPDADLYLVTGDMCPDMVTNYKAGGIGSPVARALQRDWVADKFSHAHLGIPYGACVVYVRGNHDWVNLGDPGNDELTDPEVFTSFVGPTLTPVRIGGFRGVPTINGMWNDELTSEQMKDQLQRLVELQGDKPLDILVTHCPPAGQLAYVPGFMDLGSKPLERYCHYHPPRLHAFGHIHEQGGKTSTSKSPYALYDTIYSNAAQAVNVIDLEV